MRNKEMKLQLFAQTWNPDNVTVFEHKEGTIPDKYNELILKDVMEGSKVMQLAKYEEMDSKEKKFEYFAKGPGAYWVGEGEKIKTSKPQWLTAKMVAKKLGVIVPCSRELLSYKVSDFFEKMKPKIAEAFYKKFDDAVILNADNPFPQSLEESVMESGNSISTGLRMITSSPWKISCPTATLMLMRSSPQRRTEARCATSRRSKTALLLRPCMTEQTIRWMAIR